MVFAENCYDMGVKVKVLEVILSVLFSMMIAALPASWLWSLFHIVKCRRKQNCEKRKCTYWEMCAHNEQARRADAAFRRAKLLGADIGIDLSETEDREKNS